MPREITVLFVDAMGVIYDVPSESAAHLTAFLRTHGSAASLSTIRRSYREVTEGKISATEFWNGVGIDSNPDDILAEYLSTIPVRAEIPRSLEKAKRLGLRIACISNDVADWSRALRAMHGLDQVISEWIISSEVGVRKPAPEIYRQALERLSVQPHKAVLVDDRPENLLPFRGLGGAVYHLVGDRDSFGGDLPAVHSLDELLRVVS